MKIGETTTRRGCRVVVEHVGAGCGVTIVDAAGRSQTLVCGVDDAASVARLLSPKTIEEAEERGAAWGVEAAIDAAPESEHFRWPDPAEVCRAARERTR